MRRNLNFIFPIFFLARARDVCLCARGTLGPHIYSHFKRCFDMKYSLQFLIPNLNNILAFRFYYNFIGFIITFFQFLAPKFFANTNVLQKSCCHGNSRTVFNLFILITQFHLFSRRDNRKECKQNGSNLSGKVSIKTYCILKAPPIFNWISFAWSSCRFAFCGFVNTPTQKYLVS